MRAGRLNERVILYQPMEFNGTNWNGHSQLNNAMAAIENGYKPWGPYYAEFVPGASYESVNAGELFGGIRATFRMRDSIPHKPQFGWRLLHNGIKYKLLADPIHDRRLRMLTLTCERVNE